MANESTLAATRSMSDNATSFPDTMTHTATDCSSGADYSNYVADVIITPLIVVFGVIGNSLSFIVMCIQKPALTTTLILRCLAVVDTLLLLAAIPLRTLRTMQGCSGEMDWYDRIFRLYIFKYCYPILFILRMIGTWLTVLLTVDRYIAVCKPLHAQRLITIKGAVYQITALTVFSILFYLPFYFEYEVAGFRAFARSREYVFIYRVVLALLIMYIIPIIIMIVFNSKLVFALRKAAKEARRLQRSVSNDNSQFNTSITAVVISIVVTFIVCNTLPLVAHTLFSLVKCFPSFGKQIHIQRRYITQLSNTFVTINSAVNFLIYCVCSQNFRMTFVRSFRCKAEQSISRARKSVQSSGSGNTNLSLLSSGSNSKPKEIKEAANAKGEVAILMYG